MAAISLDPFFTAEAHRRSFAEVQQVNLMRDSCGQSPKTGKPTDLRPFSGVAQAIQEQIE